MTYFSPISTTDATAALDHEAFMAAYARAEARAPYSYFDQHIIRTDDACYWVADEGEYDAASRPAGTVWTIRSIRSCMK